MVVATSRMTLAEYLSYDDGSEARYELIDGVLVEMGAENEINILIEGFLVSIFLRFVPHYLIRRGTELEVAGHGAKTRYPDLTVLTEASFRALKRDRRSIILRDIPPPNLVVEVVSPGEPGSQNYDRDYLDKPIEYAELGITEYWIIDPDRRVVLVLNLVENSYESRQFVGDEAIRSVVFPDLTLTVGQMLGAGGI